MLASAVEGKMGRREGAGGGGRRRMRESGSEKILPSGLEGDMEGGREGGSEGGDIGRESSL